ncbi:hypothetical protein LMG28727_07189 [Paraburkholderia kirstenboschensis]|uniref:response regulator n=1 Tax=Paraburkholderia kirstenboschensis TaxID=1245436 RepID=UPI00191A4142|nr:response regulator [Paraburkholderia kirstenboschensis]CAD6560583.1 hypothetical protein LMG28727_07189 [Paraburkholderia kirstenboschensis]
MEPGTDIQGRRVVIVLDDFVVAQALCGLIEDAGAKVIGPIGWLDEALAYVRSNEDKFDSAVLDVNLHGASSSITGPRFLHEGLSDYVGLDLAWTNPPRPSQVVSAANDLAVADGACSGFKGSAHQRTILCD